MNKLYMFVITLALLFILTGCGGSSGGGSDNPDTLSKCVLGTSTIDDCTL